MGKSPLYQSTPATETGKMAAVSMLSQLEGRDLITHGTGMATPRKQRQLIDVPRHMDFPQFCCLGVSQKAYLPVTNRTVYGLSCRFRLVMLQHNGKRVNLEQQGPFELKPKLSIAAGVTESLPVLFVPKRPGEHICQVEVYAQSLNPTLEPTSSIVQLRAVAEVPCIQFSPSMEVLQMGEVTWGGCTSKTIKLRNVQKASLPVRLSIWSSNSVWHCFTFDKSANSSEVSIISMSSRPESVPHNVVTVTLPGCSSPEKAETVEVTIFCRPPNKERSRALSQRPAEKVEAKVDIDVDTPVQYLPPLASLVVQATVGMPHLHIDRRHMSLSFKTEPNKNIQESILVDNSGNLSMTLAISVTTFPECFRVSPTRFTIAPQNCADITVTFSPLESDIHRYQSLLLMDIEPEGPSYEIPMEAVVIHPILKPAPLNILSSQSFLSFGGVPLSQTKSLAVKFYKDPQKAEHASVELRQSHDGFKLLSESGDWQQKCEMVIGAKEKLSMTVVCCPTAVRGYSGKLVIRKQGFHNSKFSIPLAAYGGCSSLAVSGACLTNSGQRWVEMGPLTLGHNIMQQIVLTNCGVRAAFVTASALFDIPCKRPVPPGRVGMEPNNFVLAAGCSVKVAIAFSPSQREVDLVKDRKEVVAVVRFQHGDEVMRQKYLRTYSKGCDGEGDVEKLSWQATFRQPFTNSMQEAVVAEGHTVPDSPDDCAAFFHHLSSVWVALLVAPDHKRDSAPSLSVSSLLANTSVPDGATNTAQLAISRDDVSGQLCMTGPPHRDQEDWTVKPDHLSFTVGETSHKLLQLINFTRVPLSYKLRWPRISVVPEPQEGELHPKSSTSVEVWLHMAWQKKQSELPWRGDVVVTCGGLEKVVKVQIHSANQQPSMLTVSSSQSSPKSVSAMSLSSSSRDTVVSGGGSRLQLASANIHFERAQAGGAQESFLELTSVSTEPMHWKISAFAPPYVKGCDGSSTVQRVLYNVFTVSPTSGDLLPEETVKVPVTFCPKTIGRFNQHWEIEYQPLGAGKATHDKVASKVAFTADVKSELSTNTPAVVANPPPGKGKDISTKGAENVPRTAQWDVVEQEKTHPHSLNLTSRTPLQEKRSNANTAPKSEGRSSHGLQLMDNDVTFSSTKVGQVTWVKVEFKNGLEHNVDLTVESPKPPFRTKHKTFSITRMRILKYPIEFCPTQAGTFKDVVIFKAPQLGKTFSAQLTGVAV